MRYQFDLRKRGLLHRLTGLDINQLYSFSLPMTVANTPRNNLRDMSGMDIRDVRLVQVIHGRITNWLLRPFAHGRFVTWEGFRTRTEALLWSTKLLRRSQSINLLTLEKELASSLGLNLDDFNQRIKVHDHLANLVLQFLQQHHATLTPSTQAEDMVKKFNDLNRAHELLQAQYSASLRARLPLRRQPRKMMQSWLHHHRPITHNLRHRPAPYLRSVQRPLMASRLMAQCNPESSSLFTNFLHRLPSRRRHNCSPCTARQKTSSSTTHGPVISHACISSNRPLPLLWRH